MTSHADIENTSHLAEAQIDRQLYRQPAGAVRAGGAWIPPSIQNALITAAILGLAASLWNFKESLAAVAQSVAVLKTTQEFQQRQMDRIERRQDTWEGRGLRGGPQGGRDAPNQQ